MDEYYRDGLEMKLMDGCWKWREIRDMWREGERRRLGSIVVVDGEHGEAPGIFMLDEGCVIFGTRLCCCCCINAVLFTG
ncbi:hypothetical protein Syun_025859 [Stephania yunnanensis]|uniref:Uncharacterized protein n=1 Tax=Stephania yunnanensis TaxID=152371 RepID=A0AAP0F1B4_9MAGN